MLRILFYHANDTIAITNNKKLYLGVAALYLKTYLDLNKPDIANQIEWLIPQQQKLSDEKFIELFNELQPDIICSSHYIWNHTMLMEQMGRLRNKISKKVLFVAGGPSIDVNINPNFFKKYPFIDYALYGAGEVAFADLVESLLQNKKLIKFNTSNIAWYDKQKSVQVVADFKYVPQLTTSPYTSNEELLTRIIQKERSKNLELIIPYDLTRGCPYSCTFCDWNSGLTNKTTRRKGSYKDEIDLFQKLKLWYLYLSDANVGQYQEDIDMISYLADKNINENAKFKIDGNFSKLRKENNLKIYHLMAKGNIFAKSSGFTMSVQDTNQIVLKNINRPDVGWEVHLDMIKELKEHYPHIMCKVQLIQGLPGQTLQSWRETLKKVCSADVQIHIFVSELLAASPAARDENYQEKFKFKYSQSERFNDGVYFRGQFPESCISFDKYDFIEMTILSHLYTALTAFKNKTSIIFNMEYIVDQFLGSKEYFQMKNNLMTNWLQHDKFYYSINLSGVHTNNTACDILRTGLEWASSPVILKLILKNLNNIDLESKKLFLKIKEERGIHDTFN